MPEWLEGHTTALETDVMLTSAIAPGQQPIGAIGLFANKPKAECVDVHAACSRMLC